MQFFNINTIIHSKINKEKADHIENMLNKKQEKIRRDGYIARRSFLAFGSYHWRINRLVFLAISINLISLLNTKYRLDKNAIIYAELRQSVQGECVRMRGLC